LAIQVYRIDGGKEYSSQKLIDYLEAGGTISEVTILYTPEQNGVAERANRTIWSKVQAAREGSELPNILWPELYLTAIYITNRTATLMLNGMTPAEAFKRQVQPGLSDDNYKPDLSHLQAVGCKVYVNILKERRLKSAKLDPHAEEGYLVGFEGSYIYRVYLPGRSQKIVRTLYYIFDELLLNQAESQDLENLEEDVVSNKVLIPKGILEDARLDQVYNPLPDLLAA
jgi:hypothetical protein